MSTESDDYIEIERLQRAYADVTTRQAWDEFPRIMTPDATFLFDTARGLFEIPSVEQFMEFGGKMTDRWSFLLYTPVNFVVEFGPGDTAQGHSYSLEVGHDTEIDSWVESFGTYDDRYAKHEGTWRFARRHYKPFGRRMNGVLAESFPLRFDTLR
jgi:hypothetical protein